MHCEVAMTNASTANKCLNVFELAVKRNKDGTIISTTKNRKCLWTDTAAGCVL